MRDDDDDERERETQHLVIFNHYDDQKRKTKILKRKFIFSFYYIF